MELLLSPQNLPFALALGLVVLLAALQVLALATGGLIPIGDGDGDLDVDLDADGDIGAVGSALDWLGFGRVPFLVLLLLWSAIFGFGGLVLQSLMRSMSGAFLPALLAAGITFALSLPLLRLGVAIVRPIIPRDETESVSIESLLGREAEITVGVAKAGRPAQARVLDEWGQAHYVLVEPEQNAEEFPAGARVLLLGRRDEVFRVTAGVQGALEDGSSETV
jgi:hypothetical protein